VSPASSKHDPHLATPGGKPRARAVGLKYRGTPGPHNAITDVPGVEVGYQTLIEGDHVRTGVTAIHPRGKRNPGDPLAAGFFSLNGNGEMTGVTWIEESGTMEGPIAITNTNAVGVAHAGIIAWMNQFHAELTDVWLLPVAAETWDGYLNDIKGHHVNEEHVVAALEAATGDQPDEGSVGGGTGMNCYQFKGGNGTASRLVEYAGTTYTVGVFLQANFGRRSELTLNGIYLGEEFADDNPMAGRPRQAPPGAGSVIVVVATDAPLFPSQCKAMARRVSLGLARTGTTGSHSSGDIFLAVSTANRGGFTGGDPMSSAGDEGRGGKDYDSLSFVPWGKINPFFEAVVQATEEAVANALIVNEDMTGRDGHRSPALPRQRLAEILARVNGGSLGVPGPNAAT
jgi:L-aminopeptidase/D-esterase-like protein